MNITPPLHLASTWAPIKADASRGIQGDVANTFYSLIHLPGQQGYGVVITGWGYSGFDTPNPAPEPVNVQLLGSGGNGLYDATAQYLGDPFTYGAGSVVVTDFNGDGWSDILLPAHNESPFAPLPSMAYMSTGRMGFHKVQLPDSVAAHHASLVQLPSGQAVLASTYMGIPSPLYQYREGQFEIKPFPGWYSNQPGTNAVLTGASSVAGSFDGSGNLQLVRGDVVHYNQDWTAPVASVIEVYSYRPDNTIDEKPLQVIQPYLSTLPQYQHIVSMNGQGQSHTSRLFTDDLNHDGFLDVLAGHSMWLDGRDDWPSALQILMNDGTGRFADKTATLNPSMSLNISSIDFTPVMIDLDGSGIDTYIFSGTDTLDPARQSNYLMLNDGTGRLHVGLHDEFHELSRQVKEFIKEEFREGDGFQLGGYAAQPGTVVKFIGVPQLDGTVDFIAQTSIMDVRDSANPQTVYVHTNVELSYNPAVDFKQDVVITDRNDSKLIRTWAGNDIIYDANSSVSTSINGGLGIDTVAYSTSASDANIIKIDGGFRVERGGITDTLVGIERLVFADQRIEIPTIIDDFNPLAIYRFFNQATSAHFYTASVNEAESILQNLPWFSFEGVAFEKAAKVQATTVDVHRFYNTETGVHFYTADQYEFGLVVNGMPHFNYEGVAYQAHSEKQAGTTELHRFLNMETGAHFYTASGSEMESVRVELAGIYRYEGVAFYVDQA